MQFKIILTVLIALFIASNSISLSYGATASFYQVIFHKDGLPQGMNWTISFGNQVRSSRGDIMFYAMSGQHLFRVQPINGYRASEYNVFVNVTNSSINEYINWTRGYYSVYFNAENIKNGTGWSVTVNGLTESSNTSQIYFALQNGSYDYSVGNVSNYTDEYSFGTFDVQGEPVFIDVNFIPLMNITFFMSGLNNGQLWSVTINGETYYSTTPFLYVNIDNGSYHYYVQVPQNYYATPSQGTVNENNNFVFINANSYLPWEILVAFIVIIDALLIIRLKTLKRKQNH